MTLGMEGTLKSHVSGGEETGMGVSASRGDGIAAVPDLSLEAAAPVVVSEDQARAGLAYEAVVELRVHFDRAEASYTRAADDLAHDPKLTLAITDAHSTLLDLKTIAGNDALHRAHDALGVLIARLEQHPALPPSVAVWIAPLKTFRCNLSEADAFLSIEDLQKRLLTTRATASKVTSEAASFQPPREYLDSCTALFKHYKEALSEYAHHRGATDSQRDSIEQVSTALGEVARLGSGTSLAYQEALESVLEHSTKLREQGFSCAALENAIALSAERLATIRLGSPLLCKQKRTGNSEKKVHEVWTRVVGDDTNMAPVGETLMKHFALVPASPEQLPKITEERWRSLLSEERLTRELHEVMKKIEKHKRLGSSAAGEISLSADVKFATLSALQTLISHPGKFFTRTDAQVALGATAISSALLTWAPAGGVFGAVTVVAVAAVVARSVLRATLEHFEGVSVLDTSKPTTSTALDTFLAYCKANDFCACVRKGDARLFFSLRRGWHSKHPYVRSA